MANIKTFRAKSLQEAIGLIRDELGPDASVLHTREIGGGFFGKLLGSRQIEVAASVEVQAPSRFAPPPAAPAMSNRVAHAAATAQPATSRTEPAPPIAETLPLADYQNNRLNESISLSLEATDALTDNEESAAEPVINATPPSIDDNVAGLFAIFTDLIEADVDEQLARHLLDDLRRNTPPEELADATRLRDRLPELLADRFTTTGPIQTTPGARRLVALVGPTGVGKTTTIAKLAANFRLRDKLRVGLITVDTYRVAAVEQLRTYADIIDLPMEVVSTPREMREAVDRLAGLDLILLDTAGRSPRDEVRIQELKSMLTEAQPDEVHLVLSSTAGVKQLASTTDRFKSVGVTSLLLTKLDESAAYGHLASLAEQADLPISYTTNGQNVPDDIAVATPHALADLITGVPAQPDALGHAKTPAPTAVHFATPTFPTTPADATPAF